MTEEDVLEALTAIELAEASLLSWGDTEVSFARDDLIDVVSKALPDADAEALVDDLEYGEFLYEVTYLDDGPRYRTRAAETLRLLTRIRHLFPAHGDPTGAWKTRPKLVRDYRFALRTRRVPRHQHSRDEVISRLEPVARNTALVAVGEILDEGFSLRGFQLRAAEQILSDVQHSRSRGVVVTAGTGGGKTLAFYLPALAQVASLTDSRPWVKALAVYPRNELLRDQFAAVYAWCRRLDNIQIERNSRPIRLGTLFQETPYRVGTDLERIGWKRRAGGYECPIMACPSCSDGALIWRDADRDRERERLACSACRHEVDDSTFAITRRSMQRRPPDLMFCSAEMLHATMSDDPYASLVGVHALRPPRFLLLDEIHTYEGISGAQTAQVLRRWQHLIGGPVEVVGLSATLPNAQSFLAELTGLQSWQVTPIEVLEFELRDAGNEYVVALRHDPTNRAATLSTSIQALMCLVRCLDPMHEANPVSEGVYGQRVFAFTDKLDVVNRLYADLCDAEGYTNTGRPKAGKSSLATLRQPDPNTDETDRKRDGQSWDLPRILGHNLAPGPGVRIGRVSSQDPGIDDVSSVIAATASLEVGFDDDRAGAVLQHGAPTDMARFIQRKGRAGRPEHMRPWTVVVLSDYGKDRRSYQAWDALVDPRAPAKSMPVGNRYVLRMHAVHAMLEWVASRLRGTGLRARFDLSEPSEGRWKQAWERRVEPVEELLEALLEDRGLQADLQDHVAKSLQLSPEEASVLLWESPRPLMLGAVPTLLRRLETRWRHVDLGPGGDHRVARVPLPDFISRTLFESLESPDVDVEWPTRFDEGNNASTINFETLLREFAPGNASRRFGYKAQDVVHWVPVTERGADWACDVSRNYPNVEPIGTLPVGDHEVDLVQPRRAILEEVPEDLGDRVRAEPVWSTSLTPTGDPHHVLLDRTEIGSVLKGLSFYLHVDGAGVDVARGIHATEVEWPTERGRSHRFTAAVRHGEQHAALGIRFTVDAAAADAVVPDELAELANATPQLERATKSSWFEYRMQNDQRLLVHANKFQLQWVHDAVLASIARSVIEDGKTLSQAIQGTDGRSLVSGGLDLIIGGSQSHEGSPDSRLRAGLLELLDVPDFADAVRDVAEELLKDVDNRMNAWLQRRFRTTVVTAALSAAELVASEHASDDCVADVSPHVGGHDGAPSWLTERSPGGAGFLEQVRLAMQEDRGRFARVVRTLLMPGTDARTNCDLTRVLSSADQSDVWAAVATFREARSPSDRREAIGELRRTMRRGGLAPTNETVSSLIARVGRSGADATTDKAVQELVGGWLEAERILGFELDVRVWAGLGRQRLAGEGLRLPGPSDAQAQLDASLSVLWPRGWRREADRLSQWSPFEQHLPTFPALVWNVLTRNDPHVLVPGDGVGEEVLVRLRRSGSCRVAARHGDEDHLARLLVALASTPVDAGGLLAYPRVADVSVTGDEHVASVELRESLT